MKATIYSGLILAVAAGFGCGEAPEMQTPLDLVEAVESKKLVASIRLSDTHVVSFWDYGAGDAKIHETLNVDLDHSSRIRLAEMDMTGKSLVDAYLTLAGPNADRKQVDKLSLLDTQVLERARKTVITPELERALPSDAWGQSADATSLAPAQPEAGAPGPQAIRTALACSEPSWDWQGDVGWFKNNFCGASSKFCATEFNWASYGWYRGPTWFKATGFAQSHCSGARWVFKRRAYAGFPSYGITEKTLEDRILAPRTLDTEHWTTTGDRAYYCKVSSVTGANRTALSVRHDN